jgi:hypothetical protein
MTKPTISLQELRAKIGHRAKSAPTHRFWRKQAGRRGFGWKRWSREVVYGAWGLYGDYQVRYYDPSKVGIQTNGIITSMR